MPILYQLAYTYQGLALFCIILLFLTLACVLFSKRMVKRKDLLPVFYLGALIMLLAVFLVYGGKYDLSMWANAVGLAVISAFALSDLAVRSKYDISTVLQHLTIASVVFLWVIAAAYSERTIKEYRSMVAIWVITSVLLFVHWIWALVVTLHETDAWFIKAISFVRDNVLLFPILLILTVASVPILRYPFVWDSAVYFATTVQTSSRWDFTTGSFPIFDAYFHKSFGYIALSQPGVWLFQDWTKGAHILRFLLFLTTVVMLWFVVKKWLSKLTRIEQAALVLMCVLSPAILSQSVGYNLDFGTTCFLIWFLFAWAYDLDVLKVPFAVLLLFTKEPAIVLFGGLAFGIWIVRMMESTDGMPKRFFSCMRLKEWLSLATAPLIWLMIFFLPRLFENEEVPTWGDAPIGFVGVVDDLSGILDQFGFSGKFFAIQFGHMFLMDFTWLIAIPACIMGVIMLWRKKENDRMLPNAIALPLLSALLFFYLFSSVFITHPHYRYVAPAFILIALLFAGCLSELVKKPAVRTGVYLVLSCIFLAQCYFSIDPVTNAMCAPIPTGKTTVYNYGKGYSSREARVISDYITYNLQGVQWGGMLSEVMKHVEQGENTLILVPNTGYDQTYGALGGDIYMDYRGVFWDQAFGGYSSVETKSVIKNHGGSLMIPDGQVLVATDPENRPLSVYERVYYLKLPFANVEDEQLTQAIANAGYSIVDTTDLSYGVWSMQMLRLL